ncbi:hypothetical protein Tco_0765557 [Tanacetum coccineum]
MYYVHSEAWSILRISASEDRSSRKRILLTTPRPSCEVGESSAAVAARQPGPTMDLIGVDCTVLVEHMETRPVRTWARFEAYCRALEKSYKVLETRCIAQRVADVKLQHDLEV